MTTFAEMSQRNGLGVLYYFRVDDAAGSTIAYYSTTQMGSLDARIASLGTLTRGLSADRGFAASTLSVSLDNSDGELDWISDRVTFGTQAIGSVWNLAIRIWDPVEGIAGYTEKTLGVFTLVDPPECSASIIRLNLADASLSALLAPAQRPCLRDWFGITDANRPFTQDEWEGKWDVGDVDIDEQFPLVFGATPGAAALYLGRNAYVLCAVPGTAGALPTTVTAVYSRKGGPVPQTLSNPGNIGPGGDMTVWTIRRTPDITVDGKTWHLLWLDIDLSADNFGFDSVHDHGNQALLGPMYEQLGYADEDFKIVAEAYNGRRSGATFDATGQHKMMQPIVVAGGLFSHPTNDLNSGYEIHAATVAADLINHCIAATTVPSLAGVSSVIAARPRDTAAGIVHSGFTGGSVFLEASTTEISTALRQLCSLAQFDIFLAWDGTPTASCIASDLTSQTATLATIPETLVKEQPRERIPAAGDRNSPTNRTMVSVDGELQGPFDVAEAIALWRRPIPRTVDGTWLPRFRTVDAGQNVSPVLRAIAGVVPLKTYDNKWVADLSRFSWARLDNSNTIIRPTLRVVTSLNAIASDLCDYVYFTWRRGNIGGPYIGTVWRIESMALAPSTSEVELVLVWCDDLRATDNLPYILDDETLYTRVSSGGGRTVTLTDGSTTAAFSSGNLVSDGVMVGDSLIVYDSTESASAFRRNRVLRVASITDATHLVMDKSDFSSGGPFTLSVWEIRKSAITSARATYFGKTCSSLGKFSSGTDANRILEG